ncbi:hypothetical protein GF339_12675 [candidate division KSB3 bacterium]|uniref:Histidine kinase n=1 Tax=candidate division KSB3 bacterium TaxID=2044937 RepID=A0A9D5Q6N9_9BACT|nr:hypothetical protein [candidate division KSB3 bacterium]MBD3325437.1 hypothetical protein [candidate division KSB3 bacterium]
MTMTQNTQLEAPLSDEMISATMSQLVRSIWQTPGAYQVGLTLSGLDFLLNGSLGDLTHDQRRWLKLLRWNLRQVETWLELPSLYCGLHDDTFPLELEPVSLPHIIREALKHTVYLTEEGDIQSLGREAGQKITLQLPEDPPCIQAAPHLLRIALTLLFEYALKHSTGKQTKLALIVNQIDDTTLLVEVYSPRAVSPSIYPRGELSIVDCILRKHESHLTIRRIEQDHQSQAQKTLFQFRLFLSQEPEHPKSRPPLKLFH